MVTLEEAASFLLDFKAKFGIWGIIFRDDRGKNVQTLLDLDILPVYRDEVLKDLQAVDYSEGPLTEKLNGGPDMWVFGKIVSGKEVYIKITMGFTNTRVICISFHIAAFPMKYPLKK